MKNEIGKKIKIARIKKDISQKELAQMMGKPASQIAFYENGNKKPKYDMLLNIAKTLEIPLSELLPEQDYIKDQYTYEYVQEILQNIYEMVSFLDNDEIINLKNQINEIIEQYLPSNEKEKLLYTINGLIGRISISDLETIQTIAKDYVENKKVDNFKNMILEHKNISEEEATKITKKILKK